MSALYADFWGSIGFWCVIHLWGAIDQRWPVDHEIATWEKEILLVVP